MNGYLVFKVHGGAGDPLTPLLQYSRPESEHIFLKNLKKFLEAKTGHKKQGVKLRPCYKNHRIQLPCGSLLLFLFQQRLYKVKIDRIIKEILDS